MTMNGWVESIAMHIIDCRLHDADQAVSQDFQAI